MDDRSEILSQPQPYDACRASSERDARLVVAKQYYWRRILVAIQWPSATRPLTGSRGFRRMKLVFEGAGEALRVGPQGGEAGPGQIIGLVRRAGLIVFLGGGGRRERRPL